MFHRQSVLQISAGSQHKGLAWAGAAKKIADIEIVISTVAAVRRIVALLSR